MDGAQTARLHLLRSQEFRQHSLRGVLCDAVLVTRVCTDKGLQDGQIIVIDNRRLAGQIHWLILPKEHTVRDIENLDSSHLELCKIHRQSPILRY